MSRTGIRSKLTSFLIVPLAMTAAIARADVVIEQKIDIDGAAGFSLLGMQGTTTTNLTANKSRIDSNLQFKSRLMNTFAGKSGNTSEIIRLDKGVVYDLQHKDKKYTEMTFAEMRAAMDQAMQRMEAAAQQQQQTQAQQLPVNAEECEWSPPVVEAKETGEHATVAGVDTRRAVVALKQTCTDPKTKKACDMVWAIDQWLAGDAPGSEESKAFALAYAKQLGLDESGLRAMQGRMQQAFSQYKSAWTEAMQKAGEFKGYPLKSALQMSMGGPQCTTENGTQVASDPMFADAVDASIQAGASTAAGEAAGAATQAAVESAGGGVGGAVAGSAAGAFASKLGASLMSKFKKKDKPAPAAEAAPTAETTPANTGMIRLFRVQSETTAIRSGAIPGTTFDIPAGYKKVAAQTN